LVNCNASFISSQMVCRLHPVEGRKKVAEEFRKQKIEHYLPLYKTIRQWSDRKKRVELPLIRSYVFVRINRKNYMKVLKTQHVVKVVHFLGKPVPIPEWQIKNLMILMGAQAEVSVTDLKNYEKGDEVIIKNGILQGLRGSIIKIKGKQKLLITVSALNFNIVTDINAILVEKINSVSTHVSG